MNIWDTPSNESLGDDFGDCSDCVLVYDITRKSTFEEMENTREAILKKNMIPPTFYLIGNKYDLDPAGKREVLEEDGEDFALKYEMFFEEIWAFDTEQVDSIFQKIVNRIEKKENMKAIELSKANK
jgi:GTPase SAR1 family protein